MSKNKNVKSNVISKYIFVYSILAYFLILFAIFYVWVNFNSVLMSFKQFNAIGKFDTSDMQWVGFENFKSFIGKLTVSGGVVGISFLNSIKLHFISLVISVPLYILFSYLIFKKCAGHSVFRFIVLVPSILSGFIICLMFKRFVLNGIPSLFVETFGWESFPNLLEDKKYAFTTVVFYGIWTSFSTNLIIYPNAMKEIDDGILEAAQVDGVSNMFQELFYIILPLIYPTITTFLITGFTAILTTDGSLITLYYENAPTSVSNMGYYFWKLVKKSTSYVDYPELAAGGLLMTVIVAPLTILLRWFLKKIDPLENM